MAEDERQIRFECASCTNGPLLATRCHGGEAGDSAVRYGQNSVPRSARRHHDVDRPPSGIQVPLGAAVEGVTWDGTDARIFDARSNDADTRALAERCEDDRHHFRFTVSPEDAGEMAYIKQGFRDSAAERVAPKVGPRSEREIRSGLEKEVGADRWTSLNRSLRCMTDEGGGVVDLHAGGPRKDPSCAGFCSHVPPSSNGSA